MNVEYRILKLPLLCICPWAPLLRRASCRDGTTDPRWIAQSTIHIHEHQSEPKHHINEQSLLKRKRYSSFAHKKSIEKHTHLVHGRKIVEIVELGSRAVATRKKQIHLISVLRAVGFNWNNDVPGFAVREQARVSHSLPLPKEMFRTLVVSVFGS